MSKTKKANWEKELWLIIWYDMDCQIGDGVVPNKPNRCTCYARKTYEVAKLFIQSLLQDQREEIAKDICIIIDKIESQSETNTLEEWKQYKHIRNAIRDKYKVKTK